MPLSPDRINNDHYVALTVHQQYYYDTNGRMLFSKVPQLPNTWGIPNNTIIIK